MNKVMVMGCPGSGKSVFSRKLAAITGLPLYHLDMLFWREDASFVDDGEFERRQQEILSRDSWIIDGNYGKTMELRMAQCDAVFFLDIPVEQCIQGAISRRGTKRDDLPWVEPKELDAEFENFIRRYPSKGRIFALSMLEKYSDKEIHIFTGREEADAWLERLKEGL